MTSGVAYHAQDVHDQLKRLARLEKVEVEYFSDRKKWVDQFSRVNHDLMDERAKVSALELRIAELEKKKANLEKLLDWASKPGARRKGVVYYT